MGSSAFPYLFDDTAYHRTLFGSLSRSYEYTRHSRYNMMESIQKIAEAEFKI